MSVSYCVNPACAEPTSGTDDATACPSCHASLTLREHYRSLRLLGQGGFGRTFLAVDESEDSKPRCVVKQLFPQQQNERQQASRLFRQEAQRLKSLEAHSQIPDLIDYFEIDDQQYLVQEFIDGTDLAVALKSGKTSSPEAIVELLRSLLPVLQFMHEHQVIHRDIKPANIIRRDRDQELFLVDLGAAKLATGTALAQTGTTIGSAEYTAPEQLRGKAVFASDIYSLGMTCLHLLTGVSPFNLYNADEGRLVWQDYLKTPIDKRLSRILAGMTATATRLRYGSAKDVIWELRGFPKVRIATQPTGSSSSASSKTSVPIPRPSLRPELQQPPVFKPFSLREPIQDSLTESDDPHILESQCQEIAIAGQETLVAPKKLLWSEEPSTLAELMVNVLAGEQPLSALRQRFKRSLASREAIRESIKREFPDWATGDFAWVCGRTALTLLLMLGVPALLVLGINVVNSHQNSLSRGRESSSTEDSLAEPNLNRTSSLTDSSGTYSSAADIFMRDGIDQPITASSPTQKPERGTTILLQESSLATITTTGKKVKHLEVSQASNTLLAVTAESENLERSSSLLIEVWDLESGQKRFNLPMQKSLPIVSLSADGETIFSQAFPLPFSQLDLNNIPDIKAYNSTTGEAKSISSKFENSILQGAGPTLATGEVTVVAESIQSGSKLIAGSETGVPLISSSKIPYGFFGVPQVYGELFAFVSSPISGGSSEGEVFILDLKDQISARINPAGFGYSVDPAAAYTGDLKFDSEGRLYIGYESFSCKLTCLEIYELVDGQPSYRHVPAQIPPFHELFFTQESSLILLYIPANLGSEPQLQLWNTETGSLVKQILLGQSYGKPGSTPKYLIPPVKLSADGMQLYTVHPGEIKIWDFQALLGQG